MHALKKVLATSTARHSCLPCAGINRDTQHAQPSQSGGKTDACQMARYQACRRCGTRRRRLLFRIFPTPFAWNGCSRSPRTSMARSTHTVRVRMEPEPLQARHPSSHPSLRACFSNQHAKTCTWGDDDPLADTATRTRACGARPRQQRAGWGTGGRRHLPRRPATLAVCDLAAPLGASLLTGSCLGDRGHKNTAVPQNAPLQEALQKNKNRLEDVVNAQDR